MFLSPRRNENSYKHGEWVGIISSIERATKSLGGDQLDVYREVYCLV